jgi:hypothetical protein
MWGWGPAQSASAQSKLSSRPTLNNQISGCLLSVGDGGGGGSLGNFRDSIQVFPSEIRRIRVPDPASPRGRFLCILIITYNSI